MCSANAPRRAQRIVGALPATIAATAVPHEPAPTTATRLMRLRPARGSSRAPPVRARRLGIAPPPVVLAAESRGIQLTRPRDALDDPRHHPVGRLLHVLVGPRRDRRSHYRGLCNAPLPVR